MSADGHDWCRHYGNGGIPGKVCLAGVTYATVQGEKGGYPCYTPSLRDLCASFEPKTAEEIAAHEAAITAFIEQMNKLDRGEIDTCPHCGKAIETMRQVGRCVYVYPCGDRLWQGRIPKAWKNRVTK